MRSVFWSFAVACVLGVTGCGDDTPNARSALKVRIEQWDTLFNSDASDVGTIQTADVSPDGNVFILDGANARVVRLDPETRRREAFGGMGDGPGELRIPGSIAVTANGVLVLDLATARISEFSHSGEFRQVVARHARVVGPAALTSSGDVLAPSMGYGEALAVLHHAGDSAVTVVGAIRVSPSGKRLSELQAEAKVSREWPDEFRNYVMPILADDGRAWLVLEVEGVVEAYAPSGELRWTQSLPHSITALARTRYLDRITDPASSGRLWSPQVVNSARLAGDELWITVPELAEGMAGALILDAATGEYRAEILFGVGGPVIPVPDISRRRLYLASPVEGIMRVAALPSW